MTLSNDQFKNVLDLNAARIIKQKTGTGKAIPIDSGEPLSASSEKHINDMLEMNKPQKPTYSKWQKKLGNALGLDMSE